jgi:hypothetical protein
MAAVLNVLRDYYKVIVKRGEDDSIRGLNEVLMKEVFDKCNKTNEGQISSMLHSLVTHLKAAGVGEGNEKIM